MMVVVVSAEWWLVVASSLSLSLSFSCSRVSFFLLFQFSPAQTAVEGWLGVVDDEDVDDDGVLE